MSQMAGMLLVAAPLAMVAFGVVCGTMQYAILHKVANLNGKHLVLGIGIAGLASPLVLVLGGPVTGLLRTVVPATAADLITLGVLSLLLGFATTQFVLALGPAKSEV